MHKLLKNNTSSARPTIVGLLRHGKTLWNEEKRIQGRKDSPLSMSGAKQVHEWGKFLSHHSIDRIISSDLGRVRETVHIICKYIKNVPVEYTPVLREQSWGEWEGLTFSDLQKNHGEELARQVQSGWDFCPPGGESRVEVLERTLPVFQDVIRKYSGEQILIVCHEGVVKSILYHLTGRAFMPHEKKLIQKRQFHLLLDSNGKIALGSLNLFPANISK